ncbi:GAF domain-containing protein [Ohtaekwangia kribbensis]|jgi:putative methionine-R-sulfoxide reductase with GAF domain|uniref:GAF domain-containing protein n=1 Tax=Ohtaekwangia kribbensis TaxID=688913 RepID=A0ABW3JZL7_9BACT
MKTKVKKFLTRNAITVAIIMIVLLLVTNVVLILQYKATLVKNTAIKQKAEEIKYKSGQLIDYVLHNMDLGIRAYGATKNKDMLAPSMTAIEKIDQVFDELEGGLQEQAQPYDVAGLKELRKTYIEYGKFIHEMARMIELDSMNTFRAMMSEDRGLKVFMHWNDVGVKISIHEDVINGQAEESYQAAINNNIYLQFFILIVSLPTLGFVIYKIRKDNNERFSLLTELEQNNRKYVFNPGTSSYSNDQKQLIEHSIKNLQQASEFIENISEGRYDTTWTELNDANKALNEMNLAGRLTRMRDQLKQMKKEEERRLWSNEGITLFSETVRNHQKNLTELSLEVVRFLTKYMNAQQGGLFVLKEDESESYLQLAACYAFDRKKYIEKKIEIGVGLIGQVYLEGQTTLITKVPQGYTYITSGMGEATPECLLIVPMKYNERTEAIIELASLEKFEDYHVAFIEKAGEFVASALQSVRTTEKMQNLLDASRHQAEEMRSTEEEMRQNLEELQATQEEMVRKQKEIDRIREEEAERARKVAESNRQATNKIIEKLKVTEEELRRLKEA